jgi:hypothetical protein
LNWFECRNNLLDAAALSDMFKSLQPVTYGEYDVSGNPGANSFNKTIGYQKGWNPAKTEH